MLTVSNSNTHTKQSAHLILTLSGVHRVSSSLTELRGGYNRNRTKVRLCTFVDISFPMSTSSRERRLRRVVNGRGRSFRNFYRGRSRREYESLGSSDLLTVRPGGADAMISPL